MLFQTLRYFSEPGTCFLLYFGASTLQKKVFFPFIKHQSCGFQEVICSDDSYSLSWKLRWWIFTCWSPPVHLRRCWNRERLQLHYRSAGLGWLFSRVREGVFLMAKKKSPNIHRKGRYNTSSMVMLLCFLVVMLVFFSIFFVREILHTSHVKSHIGSNRQKGQSTWVQTFLEKMSLICHITTWVFPQNYLSNSWGSQSFFVFPDLPKIGPRNFLPSSYGRWSEPRGVIGGHPGQVGNFRDFCESKLVVADWDGKNVSKYCYLYR